LKHLYHFANTCHNVNHAVWLNVSTLLLTALEDIDVTKSPKLSILGKIPILFSWYSVISIVTISNHVDSMLYSTPENGWVRWTSEIEIKFVWFSSPSKLMNVTLNHTPLWIFIHFETGMQCFCEHWLEYHVVCDGRRLQRVVPWKISHCRALRARYPLRSHFCPSSQTSSSWSTYNSLNWWFLPLVYVILRNLAIFPPLEEEAQQRASFWI
jgi:hypothetical protein